MIRTSKLLSAKTLSYCLASRNQYQRSIFTTKTSILFKRNFNTSGNYNNYGPPPPPKKPSLFRRSLKLVFIVTSLLAIPAAYEFYQKYVQWAKYPPNVRKHLRVAIWAASENDTELAEQEFLAAMYECRQEGMTETDNHLVGIQLLYGDILAKSGNLSKSLQTYTTLWLTLCQEYLTKKRIHLRFSGSGKFQYSEDDVHEVAESVQMLQRILGIASRMGDLNLSNGNTHAAKLYFQWCNAFMVGLTFDPVSILENTLQGDDLLMLNSISRPDDENTYAKVPAEASKEVDDDINITIEQMLDGSQGVMLKLPAVPWIIQQQLAVSLHSLGQVHAMEENQNAAIPYFEHALKAMEVKAKPSQFAGLELRQRESEKDLCMKATILNNLSGSLVANGDIENALSKVKEAERISEEAGETCDECRVFIQSNLGRILEMDQKFPQALKELAKARQLAIDIKSNAALRTAQNAIVSFNERQKKRNAEDGASSDSEGKPDLSQK